MVQIHSNKRGGLKARGAGRAAVRRALVEAPQSTKGGGGGWGGPNGLGCVLQGCNTGGSATWHGTARQRSSSCAAQHSTSQYMGARGRAHLRLLHSFLPGVPLPLPLLPAPLFLFFVLLGPAPTQPRIRPPPMRQSLPPAPSPHCSRNQSQLRQARWPPCPPDPSSRTPGQSCTPPL